MKRGFLFILLVFWAVEPTLFSAEQSVFRGSQKDCDGHVELSEALALCEALAAKMDGSVVFNPIYLTGELTGGTCSAMAFHFLEGYIKGVWREEEFYSSSQAMRNVQAAYNTIEITEVAGDPGRQKIQALLDHFGYSVEAASQEVDVRSPEAETLLRQQVEELEEGIYVIRILEPSSNHRLEKQGHTLIYILGEQGSLLYDPNRGLSWVDSSFLYFLFYTYFLQYKIYEARFYRVLIPQAS